MINYKKLISCISVVLISFFDKLFQVHPYRGRLINFCSSFFNLFVDFDKIVISIQYQEFP